MNTPAPKSRSHTSETDAADIFIHNEVVPLMQRLVKELKDIALATQEDKDFRAPQFPTDGPNGEMGRMMQEMYGVGETPSVLQSREYNAAMHRAANALVDVGEKAGMVELALLVAEIREHKNSEHKNAGRPLAIRPQAATVLHKHYPAQMPFVALAKPEEKKTEEKTSAVISHADAVVKSQNLSKITRRGVLALIAGGAAKMLYDGHTERADAKAELKQLVLDEIDLESKGPTMTVEERKKLLTLQRLTRPALEDKTGIPASNYVVGAVGGGALIALLVDVAASNQPGPKRIPIPRSEPDYDMDYEGDDYSPPARPRNTVAEIMGQIDDALSEASINGRFQIPSRSDSTRGK